MYSHLLFQSVSLQFPVNIVSVMCIYRFLYILCSGKDHFSTNLISSFSPIKEEAWTAGVFKFFAGTTRFKQYLLTFVEDGESHI